MTEPAPTNGPLPRRSLSELVEAIRERITRGELAPGERLWEERLAAELGVSRIPMREALRALASEGFVRSERYGGTFVAALDADAAHDLLDVRAVLEPLAAAQAATRRTPDQLAELRRLLDNGIWARRDQRYEDMRTLKGQFFEQLAIASGNSTLVALMHVVRFKIEWATSIELIKRAPRETRTLRANILREIVDAVADGDPARAATAAAANVDAAYASQGWRRVVDTRFEPATKSV
ncbi:MULTISPECIES: GntR family transcriptional regulator [unclassified Pseudofrankia]|uniref:GntR family transcriptional regulator n=1 Tax=unclassified Pseudofrankia TaxID=2994372 RepID=UPI0008D9A6A5|nr:MULTISPECIES: GntR family transcriptional regulator [unclassified Pseudofrankia]MDT3445797.1 GntR family transcriptional regulator [Pseudofrankia sp. BMG5.37]OHV62798.1 GntR family transcriptional regulator [Pseudofrankia sp. BMG5.36]